VRRSDPWHCEACGGRADLADRSLEVGLVRFAVNGEAGFELGSHGLEDELRPLLRSCQCGGRLAPGPGTGEPVAARFDLEAWRAVAAPGWQHVESSRDDRLVRLRDVWRPRALVLLGREDELSREEVLGLRLEDKLAALAEEIQRAREAGDDDAAETAHARYIELGTTYARRFVAHERSDA
jgi:hypothetical protein